MASHPWPRSLRSPLWPYVGCALFGALSFRDTECAFVSFLLIAAAAVLVGRWREAGYIAAICMGNWNAQRAAQLGEAPNWSGSGCFVCVIRGEVEQTDWGWRTEARCRGGGLERMVRLEGREPAPLCEGTFQVWAQWEPWAVRGSFDESKIYGSRGWAGRLRVRSELEWWEARTPEWPLWRQWILAGRASLLERYRERLSPAALGFVWGISTGDKSLLSPDLRSAFSRIGLAHVLAVSGYHVGLVGFIPLLFARSRRQSLRVLALLGIPLLGAFVLFCGGSESAVRAWTMASLLIVASAIRRPGSLGHSLNVAAWAMLVFHPWALQQLGTQLSFVAVLGIALGLEAASTWRPSRWAKPVVVPLAAQSATTPIAVPTFLQFPLGFLPVNLVAGPWVSAIGALLLCWLIWPFDDTLSRGLLWALNGLVEWLMRAVQAFGEWDGCSYRVVQGDLIRWWAMGLGSLAMFIGCFRRHTWWIASALFWASVPWWPRPPAPRSDWAMERDGVPDLRIMEARWTGKGARVDSSAARAIDGIGCWQHPEGWIHASSEGKTVTWVGLQRKGTWRFHFEPKRGMGRLEIDGHAWIWERWHDRTQGAWPVTKMGTEVPIDSTFEEVNSDEAAASLLGPRTPPIRGCPQWAEWR